MSVCAVMFYKQFFAYTVHIDRSAFSNNPYTFMWVSTHICVNYMHIIFLQVCIIGPSFFTATSGMHRRLFEGRHLVLEDVFVY